MTIYRKPLGLLLLLSGLFAGDGHAQQADPTQRPEHRNTPRSAGKDKEIRKSISGLFPIGTPITNGNFSGEAFLMPLLSRDRNNDFVLGCVTFKRGARTKWHTHPKGQVLLVTGGMGFYQEKGKPARVIKKGDIVNIPENVEHWHGASAKTAMEHIAVTNFKGDENVVWLQPVTDQEYKQVH